MPPREWAAALGDLDAPTVIDGAVGESVMKLAASLDEEDATEPPPETFDDAPLDMGADTVAEGLDLDTDDELRAIIEQRRAQTTAQASAEDPTIKPADDATASAFSLDRTVATGTAVRTTHTTVAPPTDAASGPPTHAVSGPPTHPAVAPPTHPAVAPPTHLVVAPTGHVVEGGGPGSVLVRPQPQPTAAPREATHIDIAAALGVGPIAPAASTRTPTPTTGPREPLLPSIPLPKVLEQLRPSPDRRPPKGRPVDAQDIRRAAATADSVARLIPMVMAAFLLIASALVATLLLSGRTAAQEHVELRFLGRPGSAVEDAAADQPSRISIVTEPEGILVLHGRDILGKTPVSLDLPVRLDARVAVELTGPYFERWVGEISPDDAGAYRVHVQLKRKP